LPEEQEKKEKMSEEFEPRIVAFLCNWCSYAGADVAGSSKLEMPPTVTPVKVMCSSRVDPVMVITAFLRGADGVPGVIPEIVTTTKATITHEGDLLF